MECNWEECKLKHLDGKLSCFIIFHKLLWEDALLANEYKTEDQITFFFFFPGSFCLWGQRESLKVTLTEPGPLIVTRSNHHSHASGTKKYVKTQQKSIHL